jgi:SAM-dependent methyltransferase
MTTPDEFARRLAAQAVAADDPTGWFERVYAAAEAGQTQVPWDRGAPNWLLVDWARAAGLAGAGLAGARRSAVVVGCGLGEDAEFVAGLGFDTTAFDISPTALRAAKRRYPDSPVRYGPGDMLNLPGDWLAAFDLVVESLTLQALSDPPRASAIASVGRLVGPAGTLIVIARAREPGDPDEGPPWALTRAEIDALAGPGLVPVRIEDLRDPGPPAARRWRAEFRRPAAGPR